MSDIIFDYWESFCETCGIDTDLEFEAFNFGDSKEMADTLAELVVAGKKTATSSGYDLYKLEEEPLPKIGEYRVILNGSELPVCVIQITKVDIVKLKNITAEQAALEGEGDLSLDYWMREHVKFLQPIYEEFDIPFNDSTDIVFEIFKVVYQ